MRPLQIRMSTTNNNNDEYEKHYVKCPYFPEHEVQKKRLGIHLLKCQSKPNAPNLAICPFNYLHRIDPDLKHEHFLECEDRIYGMQESATYRRFAKQKRLPIEKKKWDVDSGEEEW